MPGKHGDFLEEFMVLLAGKHKAGDICYRMMISLSAKSKALINKYGFETW